MPLIVFVCTGNICRSPMAEALLRHYLPSGSPWKVASAGTFALDGDEASPGAIEVLAENMIDLRGHRSRPFSGKLARDAAIIAAMTRSHRDDILALHPAAAQKVFLLRHFDPRAGSDKDIADPISGTLEVYRRCRDTIAAAIPGLLEFLADLSGADNPSNAPTAT